MARILLIDDDELFRTALYLRLGEMGHVVIEARNGVEGLNLFRSTGADLVITDILMPEKDGLAVLMALRNERSPVNVIAMSGNGMFRAMNNLHIAKLLGAAKVLEKPFTSEALTSAINEVLTKGRTLARPAQPSFATTD